MSLLETRLSGEGVGLLEQTFWNLGLEPIPPEPSRELDTHIPPYHLDAKNREVLALELEALGWVVDADSACLVPPRDKRLQYPK